MVRQIAQYDIQPDRIDSLSLKNPRLGVPRAKHDE